jgi:type VI secretion system protein ImpL
MGVLKKDLSSSVASFLDQSFDIIGERLRHLRILLLQQLPSKAPEPGIFLFPEEFDQFRRGLGFFMEATFRENPYQETPILRGLYFSSGRQEGTPFSHFLKNLGLIGEKELLPGTNKGLFLHDFFGRILPRERGLLAPTRRAMEWRTLTRNLGLVSWMVLGVAFCGLLSFSFLNDLEIINEIPSGFAQPIELTRDIQLDLESMREFRDAILKVEERNRAWKIPRFGLDATRKVERALKEKYCFEFQKGFLESHEQDMGNLFNKLPDSIPDGAVAPYVNHLVKRIRLLQDQIAGKDLRPLQEKPRYEKILPSYDLPMGGAQTGMPSEAKGKFSSLYLYYQLWRSDRATMEKELSRLQISLDRLLSQKGGQLRWLVAYANEQGLLPVTLGDYWKGATAGTGETTIAPAFTREGKKAIDDFLNEVKFSDPGALANKKEEFEKYYRKECLQAWQQFVSQFPKGMERIGGSKEWQQMAEKMGTDQGPYFEFLGRMEKELVPLVGKEDLPLWLRQVYQLQTKKTLETAGQTISTAAGPLTKAADEVKRYLTPEKKELVKEGEEEVESALALAKTYQEYRSALTAMVPISASRNQAFEQASRVFSEDPMTSKTPFFVASGALSRMKEGMGGKRVEGDLWMLLAGPLKFYELFMRLEGGCHLQGLWDSMVLSEMKEAQALQATPFLLSSEGPVEKFLRGPASPFIVKSGDKGYHSKKVGGESLPFDPSFFSFLQQRETGKALMMKNNYILPIKGFPGEANPGARSLPQRTVLQLQCGAQIQALEIFSYPKPPQTFQWVPNSCSDVFFQVEIGEVTLKKRYSGPLAFPEFLQDFQGGMRTFYPDEFPAEKAALERMGIKYIRVRYEIGGDQLAVRRFTTLPKQAPGTIVRCWDREDT